MSDDVRLSELYHHAYAGATTASGDEVHHQLMDGLSCLMNVSGDLDAFTRAVALSTIASAIARFRTRDECPTYMYFAETFPSISEQDRACVLLLTIPHLISTSNCAENAWWFIEVAIKHELCSLLHLTFIEDAMNASDPSLRFLGASALVALPISYWDNSHQYGRRNQLIERALKDENELVRQAVTNRPEDQH